MDEDANARRELAARIEERRRAVRDFLRRARPRRTRLTNISILGSSLAAAFAVGPAAGGSRFTDAVKNLFALPDDSLVWRVLCLGAALLSLAAAVATSLANSAETASQVSAAESCLAELEGLQLSLSLGTVPLNEVLQAYQQAVAKVPFLADMPAS